MTKPLGVVLALAAAPALRAQSSVALTKPDAETRESFTQIASIRELPSGKVLLADSRDKIVQLIDLSSGAMTKVGREGNGPGEYALPITLIGLPDGTTLVHDILNRRFLMVGPDGKPGGFLELPRPPAPSSGGGGPTILLGGIQQVRGYDNQGRLYFSGSPFSPTGGSVDSIPLMRWDRVKPNFDTVGYLKLPPNSAQSTNRGGNFTIRVGNSVVFTPAEAWAVAGDGSIARVFPNPYRVAWLGGGRATPVVGPVVPYTPMKVTEADKAEVIERRRRNPGTVISIGGPGGAGVRQGGGGGGGGGGGVSLPPPEFADTKPPFEGGTGVGGTVQATPDGEVWVLRTRPAADKTPSYDVFDKTGTLVRKVTLNPNSRVVGFGKGTVYVARSDEDDLQYLQRYKKP